MKDTPDNEQAFRLHMTSLLRRLQQAGWITHFEEPDPDTDELVIVWNEEKKPMGGKTTFYAMSTMLQDICPEKLLSDEEQAMIQILRQIYFEPDDVS